MNSLLTKIQKHEFIVGIIGLGYVGLPLVIRFSQEGFKVVGFDIDKEKINQLNEGKSYIRHINAEDISAITKNGFTATTDFSKIADVDAIIICVPTPLDVHNEPDLSYIHNTLKNIKLYLKDNQLLILESTTYPGTTEEVIVPYISSKKNSSSNFQHQKFTIGVNFYLGYSPEREDPGNKNFTTKTIPKVVSGITKNCLELTKSLYDQIVDKTVPVSSTKVAEMTKILENIHRAVNIGLVNELKMVANKMDIDIYEVINAAATKPFGFTPYYPGPGLGGHCIPIDPFYLSWKAKQIGLETRFIELAGEVNSNMPDYVVQKINEGLNTFEKSIENSNILILGLAYKKNVDDNRESPSFKIIENLIKMGANVQYSDPFIPKTKKTRKYNYNLASINLTPEKLNFFDVVVLCTDHDDFDYDMIANESKLIVDTRGKFQSNKKIIKA